VEWLDGVPLLSATLNSEGNGKVPVSNEQPLLPCYPCLFQQVYIDGFFHADPHPGNLFYLKDGRGTAGLWHGRALRTQQILTEMLLAIVDLDGQRCAQLTLQIADSAQPVILSRLRL